jgi:predicted dithiol-disulfide oxidoreductase (DUF899 family)
MAKSRVRKGVGKHRVVPHKAWIEARRKFLAKEKKFTRLRDELARQRRTLPWEKVEKQYVFEGAEGRETLAGLFEGKSQFYKDEGGAVFHTYSSYARGIDMLNTAYHYLDLVPKGRDEDSLEFTQSWVRYHDKYED